jgi:hypothetical protein
MTGRLEDQEQVAWIRPHCPRPAGGDQRARRDAALLGHTGVDVPDRPDPRHRRRLVGVLIHRSGRPSSGGVARLLGADGGVPAALRRMRWRDGTDTGTGRRPLPTPPVAGRGPGSRPARWRPGSCRGRTAMLAKKARGPARHCGPQRCRSTGRLSDDRPDDDRRRRPVRRRSVTTRPGSRPSRGFDPPPRFSMSPPAVHEERRVPAARRTRLGRRRVGVDRPLRLGLRARLCLGDGGTGPPQGRGADPSGSIRRGSMPWLTRWQRRTLAGP